MSQQDALLQDAIHMVRELTPDHNEAIQEQIGMDALMKALDSLPESKS